jgi:hypothetical protein
MTLIIHIRNTTVTMFQDRLKFAEGTNAGPNIEMCKCATSTTFVTIGIEGDET